MSITYRPIETQTLGSAAATVTFSSILSTYTDLVLVANIQVNTGGGPIVTFNADTGSNYSVTRLWGAGSSASSNRSSSQTGIDIGADAAASITADIYTPYIFNIMNYSNSTTYKTSLLTLRTATGGYGGTGEVNQSVGLWRNTNAINSITLTAAYSRNFQSGSSFTLYGIKAE